MLFLCTIQPFEYDTNLLVREFFPGEEIKRRNDTSDACFFRDNIVRALNCFKEDLYPGSLRDEDGSSFSAAVKEEPVKPDGLKFLPEEEREEILFADYSEETTIVVEYSNGLARFVRIPFKYPHVLPKESGKSTETADAKAEAAAGAKAVTGAEAVNGAKEEAKADAIEETEARTSAIEETEAKADAIEETEAKAAVTGEAEKSAARKKYKQAHMHNLYLALRALTGKELPWGSLTGVRPTKLARQMFLRNETEAQVMDFYRNERFVSEEKSLLATEIAKREIDIISSCHPIDGYSVYIGIPFCPSRCAYCSFLSGSMDKWQDRIEEYLSCIEKELRFVHAGFGEKIIDTVYIGGGTPTALSAEELKVLTDMVSRYLPVDKLAEYTVEAGRPDSITAEKLKVLKQAGVSRISVNPQSMNDETLLRIGRRHTVRQILEAYELARNAGFDNINTDMIIGLPGEGIKEVETTVREIEKLNPDSLTVHSLAIKRSSRLREERLISAEGTGRAGEDEAGKNTPDKNARDTSVLLPEEKDPVKMMAVAYEGAARLGLHPYYLYRQKNIAGNLENVGFAREGKYGIYNILMMEEVQTIVALGAGTVTKRVISEKEISRCDTAKDIGLYMDGIEDMIERKKKLFF